MPKSVARQLPLDGTFSERLYRGSKELIREVSSESYSKYWFQSTAIFNMAGTTDAPEAGEYRYVLHRVLKTPPDFENKGRMVAIALNPSTATEMIDDPTVRRMMGFALRWGYGELTVLNAFALRSTNPRVLKTHPDPVGPLNSDEIYNYVHSADMVLVCWSDHATLNGRATALEDMLRNWVKPDKLYSFGLTKKGQPRHPLYLRNDMELHRWPHVEESDDA